MNITLIKRFAPTIVDLKANELSNPALLMEKLELANEGGVQIVYTPFEHVNPEARVVLVGITPGTTQLVNSVREAQKMLQAGSSMQETLKAAKAVGAFSGPMRAPLVSMLNEIGLHKWLGLQDCAELFTTASHLVHTTSTLRNAVFVNGEMYNKTPSIFRNQALKNQLFEGFVQEAKLLPNAVYIPLGAPPRETLQKLVEQGVMAANRVLDGLPHPSGSNNERIAYFLGRKGKAALSSKTNAESLDEAKSTLIAKLKSLK